MAVEKNLGLYMFRAVLVVHTLCQGSPINSELLQITECICPRHILTYQCTVCGEGATEWTGSIFNCTINGIILSHRLFEDESRTRRDCNNGAVTAHSVGVSRENNTNCYISQLHISINTDINNKTVTCAHNFGSNQTVVDTKTTNINLTAAADIPPAEDLRLIEASPNHLTITWTPPMFNCSDVNYVIIGSRNCGSCINTTINDTSSTCTNMSIDGQVCSLSVQTELENCDVLNETISDSIKILLQVPESPVITDSSYSAKTKEILITFNQTVMKNSFGIFEGIDGSATTYYLTYYSDPSTREFCGSTSVDASTCENGICHSDYSYERLLPGCIDSEIINVTVHALNVFGNGSKSEPVQIMIESNDLRVEPTTSTEDMLLFATVVTTCVVLVGVLFIIVIVTVIILIHRIKKARNILHRKSNRNISSDVEENTFVVPDVLYADVAPFTKVTNCLTSQSLLMEDQKVGYSEIVHQKECVVLTEEVPQQNDIDKYLNLDTLLIQLGSHVAHRWNEFGQAARVPNSVLDKCMGYPSMECFVEVLDTWLRSRKESKPTWKDVADILKAIGEVDIAENILKVYKTGVLPVKDDSQLPSLNEDDEESVPPPLPPKSYVLD